MGELKFIGKTRGESDRHAAWGGYAGIHLDQDDSW